MSQDRVRTRAHLGWLYLRGDHIAFARSEKEILFKTMLAGIEVVVTTSLCEQFPVISALNNATLLNDEYLLGATDRRKPVSNYKCSTAKHQLAQPGLNHGF